MSIAALGIDAAIHKKVIVYRSPSTSSTKRDLTVAPIAVQRRKGIELTIVF